MFYYGAYGASSVPANITGGARSVKSLFSKIYAEVKSDPKVQGLSEDARLLCEISHVIAWDSRTCYPNWSHVEKCSAFDKERFMKAFEELCEIGLVFNGFPSLLVALAEQFPLAPMWGPIAFARPSASVWNAIRTRIFERDNYTCVYCGSRGVVLECDHIHPFSKGGGHDDENLATSCKKCNRSKLNKTVSEWIGK